jgi:hypothetical protein
MLLGLCLAGTASLHAQRAKTVPVESAPRPTNLKRCATMEALKIARQRNPQGYEQEMMLRRQQTSRARVATLSGPVTIPVIVHVVLTNPNIITEAQVDALINRLNLDYAGLNPDSTNGSAFYGVRGHSKIRFARARRTPAGQLTNGIERRVGLTQIEIDTYQPIKHTSAGGLDPWDINQYYNLWVGSAGSSGLLGIAPAIGKGNATETTNSSVGIDGICVDYRAFSTGCFSEANFNMGRTVVHEIGHNLGLLHIFSGCTAGDDFDAIDNVLPASMIGAGSDDTPSQSVETSGCLSGPSQSDCGTGAKMYQNYMDYTDDACYSMFTKKQVERMEYILENYRSGYITSLGATPPTTIAALDISPSAMLSPGGVEFNNTNCSIITYGVPMCAGNVTPRIEVTNNGTSTITSLTVSAQVNSGTPVTSTITGLNITTGSTAFVSLPSVALITGTNTIKFTTSAPNGGTDAVSGNDVMTQTVTIASPVASPITESMEGTFPPASFSVVNVDGDTTWRRAAPGRSSSYSLFINNWDNENVGSLDDFRSVPMNLVAGADSLVISFDQAYKFYRNTSGSSVITDTLQVLVTNDCGATYSSVFKKGGATLSVAGGINTEYTTPIASDWRNERIALSGSVLTPGRLNVIFRNKDGYGNNLFLDNINITSACKTTTFTSQPAAVTVCSGQGASFTVGATGNASLTYQWKKDGTDISGATSTTYSIASAAAANAGNYTVTITNACGISSTTTPAALIVNTGGSCSGSAVSSINPDIEAVVLMPNVVRNNSTIRVKAVRAMKIDWIVIDAQGSIVKRFTQNVTSGQNDIKLNVQELASGAYQLVGNSSKGKTNTIKFVRL